MRPNWSLRSKDRLCFSVPLKKPQPAIPKHFFERSFNKLVRFSLVKFMKTNLGIGTIHYSFIKRQILGYNPSFIKKNTYTTSYMI